MQATWGSQLAGLGAAQVQRDEDSSLVPPRTVQTQAAARGTLVRRKGPLQRCLRGVWLTWGPHQNRAFVYVQVGVPRFAEIPQLPLPTRPRPSRKFSTQGWALRSAKTGKK